AKATTDVVEAIKTSTRDIVNSVSKEMLVTKGVVIKDTAMKVKKVAHSERARISLAQALDRVIDKEYLTRIVRVKTEQGSREMDGIRHYCNQRDDEDDENEGGEERERSRMARSRAREKQQKRIWFGPIEVQVPTVSELFELQR
ncbi:hypothetical protein BGZ95_004401, partial [Linnemannia exigua]